MSDWVLLFADPPEDGVATSTNSDDGFTMMNHITNSTTTTGIRDSNVTAWLHAQPAVDAHIEASSQNNSVPPDASKPTDNSPIIANQVEIMQNPSRNDEFSSSETTADSEVPRISKKTSTKSIMEDRATPTFRMFSMKAAIEEKASSTSMTKPDAKINPKIAVAASQGSMLGGKAVKGSNTSNTPATPIADGENEQSSILSMSNHKLLIGPSTHVLNVSSANLRHCVFTISGPPLPMPSKVSVGVDAKFAQEGIIGMLDYILWANIYLLWYPKCSFWKEVLRAASAKIPLTLVCWVMVKGWTQDFKAVFTWRNMLERGNKKLFNEGAFIFTFSKGKLH